MADTLAHLKRDRCFWKRLLRFAGYYHGKIDWLNTKEFRFSQAKWKNETEGLRRILAYFDAFVFFFGGFYGSRGIFLAIWGKRCSLAMEGVCFVHPQYMVYWDKLNLPFLFFVPA